MRLPRRRLLVVLLTLGLAATAPLAWGEPGVEFPGTVLTVDAAAGKLTVKKDPGGTRFTFTVDDKTRFGGADVKGLSDVKKGDRVTVTYATRGSLYVAQAVTVQRK
ncbi:hypothetical protein [Candidatus Nitrospira bockiana]